MAPQPKRRKAPETPSHSPRVNVVPVEKRSRVGTSVTTIHEAPEAQSISGGVNMRIQQARNAAVAQAQKDGATGNFRIFDSPFGNFLVPVIPTAKELAD